MIGFERAIERRLQHARLLFDFPAQQAVIRVDETVGFDRLAQADRAPQPPVGRVQRVGVVCGRRLNRASRNRSRSVGA